MTNINDIRKDCTLESEIMDPQSSEDTNPRRTSHLTPSQSEDQMDQGISFHHGMKFCESFDNNSVIYHGDPSVPNDDKCQSQHNDLTHKGEILEPLHDSIAYAVASSPNDLNHNLNVSSCTTKLSNGDRISADPRTLPYHERKQVIETYDTERQTSQAQNYKKNDKIGSSTKPSRPPDLYRLNMMHATSSTRNGTTSAPNLSHGGIPTPRNRTFSNDLDKHHDKGFQPPQKVINRPSSIHVRNESSGSVSSLGSMTGGASSMTPRELSQLSEALNNDIRQYIDTSKGIRSKDNHSSGILTNLLASVSGSSFESNQSIEKMTDKFHKKNQKFLSKTERQKDRSRKRDMIRSLSPSVQSHRSHRPRLPSIDNDNWEENDQKHLKSQRNKTYRSKRESMYGATDSSKVHESQRDRYLESQKRDSEQDDISSIDDESCISSDFTSVFMEDGDSSSSSSSPRKLSKHIGKFKGHNQPSEYTSLLPSGELTHEQGQSKPAKRPKRINSASAQRDRNNNNIHRSKGRRYRDNIQRSEVGKIKEMRKIPLPPKKNRHIDSFYGQTYRDEEDSSSSDGIDFEIDDYTKHLLKIQRERLMMQWSQELEIFKEEQSKRNHKGSRWYNQIWAWFEGISFRCRGKIATALSDIESFVCNLPLTIGAIGLAVVTLGVVWFKFTEEMMKSCQPVHYHSDLCTFPEFPGCFACENKEAKWYRVALTFHRFCSTFAGIIALLFCLKIILAPEVIRSEMNSPTTSSPAGLICMTIVCIFAGVGRLGEWVVISTATIHFIIAIWFLYMAQCYNSLPDPSWFPNTIGLGVSAVKTWLYFPIAGQLLMLVSVDTSP